MLSTNKMIVIAIILITSVLLMRWLTHSSEDKKSQKTTSFFSSDPFIKVSDKINITFKKPNDPIFLILMNGPFLYQINMNLLR